MTEDAKPIHPAPGMGDNQPPAPQLLREQLMEKYQPLLQTTTKELTDQLQSLPEPLPDDRLEEASELIKASTVQLRKIDAMRQTEKEPFLVAERVVDGYFKGLSNGLENARKRARPIYETAHDLRANAARRAAEEEARKLREAAAKQREEAEALARKQREEADRIFREAEAAERRRLEEAERFRREQTAANEQRQREAAAEARRLQQQLEQHEAAAIEAEKLHERAENREQVAITHEQRIETAKPAEFARVRTDHGVVVTQVETWDFLIIDRDKLPRTLLWRYLPREAIDAAIKAAIEGGVREMKGVKIFPRRTSVIR